MTPQEESFWRRTGFAQADLFACWEWRGARDPNGYGRVNWHGKPMLTHRVAYMLLTKTGTLDEHHILHSCDNPPCCNPFHLRPGTARDNVNDMWARGRQQTYSRVTHCRHGHEYTAENTLWVSNGRQCRACNRLKAREYHYKHRAEILPKLRARAAIYRRTKRGLTDE